MRGLPMLGIAVFICASVLSLILGMAFMGKGQEWHVLLCGISTGLWSAMAVVLITNAQEQRKLQVLEDKYEQLDRAHKAAWRSLDRYQSGQRDREGP